MGELGEMMASVRCEGSVRVERRLGERGAGRRV